MLERYTTGRQSVGHEGTGKVRAKVEKEYLPRRNFHERHGDSIDDEYDLCKLLSR